MQSAQNPANLPSVRVTDETRIPLTLPRLQLEVPEIPGHVCYWFVDRPGRINRALQGGYEFVDPAEVAVNNFSLGDDNIKSGNSDLGTRVSVHGGVSESGGAERLYLMKIKKEWWEKDQATIADRNEQVAAALRGGRIAAEQDAPGDSQHRYVRSNTNLFTKKRRS